MFTIYKTDYTSILSCSFSAQKLTSMSKSSERVQINIEVPLCDKQIIKG